MASKAATVTKRAGRGPQVPYAERWPTLTDDEKRRLFGDRVPVLDALAVVTDDDRRAALLADAEARMASVVARLAATSDHVERLRAERNVLIGELALLGKSQSDIASMVGKTNGIISQALGVIVKAGRA